MAVVIERQHYALFRIYNLYMADLVCYALQKENYAYTPDFFLHRRDMLAKKRFSSSIGDAVLKCKTRFTSLFQEEIEELFLNSLNYSEVSRVPFLHSRISFTTGGIFASRIFYRNLMVFSAFIVDFALYCARAGEIPVLASFFNLNKSLYRSYMKEQFIIFSWNEYQRYCIRYCIYNL